MSETKERPVPEFFSKLDCLAAMNKLIIAMESLQDAIDNEYLQDQEKQNALLVLSRFDGCVEQLEMFPGYAVA